MHAGMFACTYMQAYMNFIGRPEAAYATRALAAVAALDTVNRMD